MNDPYSVLGITPEATDEEVKQAYRALARKYHPDNYQDNPLADLAEEKMKEINEAYEAITKMRAGGGYQASSSGGYQSRPSGGSAAPHGWTDRGQREYESARNGCWRTRPDSREPHSREPDACRS